MKQLVTDTYGSAKVTNAAPQIVDRNGQSYIALQGTDSVYYFLLIKDDTGEVNSMGLLQGIALKRMRPASLDTGRIVHPSTGESARSRTVPCVPCWTGR